MIEVITIPCHNRSLCKKICLLTLVFILFTILGFTHASDKDAKGGNHNVHHKNREQDIKTGKSKRASPLIINYRPPMRGRPGNRVGGGTRGNGEDMPFLAALAPDHPGLTTRPQPELYWYISRPISKKIEFTLINEHHIRPLLEIGINTLRRKGVQCLRLSDYGINLLPDVEYQWFVAVVVDPNQRSKDIVAGGTIKYVEPSKILTDRLNHASRMETAGIYAEEGFWYDVLSAISESISTDPYNRDFCELRNNLLEQVGLSEIAEYERSEALQ